jgi:DNA-binding transcriptional MerR regulator
LTLDYALGCTLEVSVRNGQEGSMQIGQMSKETGLSVDAIRFYERNGLLAAPARSEGGFRLYTAVEVSTLHFIRNLQTFGFSLNEIREFLSLRTDNLRACSEVKKRLDRKLQDIHAKRVALTKLEHELKAALTKCNSELKRPRTRKNGHCPILTVFSESKHKSDQ